MIGTIAVEGLEIECIIGVLPREMETPQIILVDVEIDVDFAAAARSDDIADTVDYVAIADDVTAMAVNGRYRLLERFAEDIAARMLGPFGAQRVAIKIMKPAAIPAASWSVVKIERRR